MVASCRWLVFASLLTALHSKAAPVAHPLGEPVVAALGPPIIDHEVVSSILIFPTVEDCPKVREGQGLISGRPGAVCEEFRLGPDKFAFALDMGRWEIALDLDRDGVIADGDWAPMPDNGGEPQANVVIPREVDGRALQVSIGLRWRSKFERLAVMAATRSGELPLPGGPVRAQTSDRRGVWTSGSPVGIDLDRSGHIDVSDRFESASNDRVIAVDGVFWHVLVDPRGDTLTARPVAQPEGLLARGVAAPTFDLPGLDGEPYSVARFRGRWLIMDFWGTWCGPCKAEMPGLIAWKAEQPDDVDLLGMASDKVPALRAYLKKNPHPWPDVAITKSDGLAKRFGVRGWPTYVLVDPDGNLQAIGALVHIKARLTAARRERREGQ